MVGGALAEPMQFNKNPCSSTSPQVGAQSWGNPNQESMAWQEKQLAEALETLVTPVTRESGNLN